MVPGTTTSRKDKQRDRQTTCSRNTSLCVASRGKNSVNFVAHRISSLFKIENPLSCYSLTCVISLLNLAYIVMFTRANSHALINASHCCTANIRM